MMIPKRETYIVLCVVALWAVILELVSMTFIKSPLSWAETMGITSLVVFSFLSFVYFLFKSEDYMGVWYIGKHKKIKEMVDRIK